MKFPISFYDIGLLLAVMSIIVLITSELLNSSSIYSRNIVIDRKKLKTIALTLGIGFLFTVVIHVFETI